MTRELNAPFLAVAMALAVVCGGSAAVAESGTLKGRFIYDGTPPAPVRLAITRDAEVCAAHAPVDESLVVAKDGGLKNVLIWVRDNGLETPPPEGNAVLDNDKCRFAPHVVLLHTGQTLEVKNSDPVAHNANITTVLNPASNQTVASGGSVEVRFANEERLPTRVSCGIHPWMNAWVLIRGNSYMAVTAEDGSFEISGLPADRELEFQVWHEKGGYLSNVSIDGADPGWARGRFKLSVDGEHDLGEIKVPAAAFE